MSELIKNRKAEMSTRGIYVQDRELLETVFQIGSYFKFEEDKDNRMVTVLPAEEKGRNTVSKRKLKNVLKPVIDIRKKTVLEIFEGCQELEISIYKNRIEIKGLVAEAEEVAEEAPGVCPECNGAGEVFNDFLEIEKCTCQGA